MWMQVAISLLRVLLFVARPRTCALGNIPDSMIYRSVDQYPVAHHIPGILILQIEAPIYFANSNYLRERYVVVAKDMHVTVLQYFLLQTPFTFKMLWAFAGSQDGSTRKKIS